MPNPRSLGGRRRTAHIDGVDDLREGIAYLKNHAKKVGRSVPLDVFFPIVWKGAIGTAAFDAGAYCAHLAELEAVGVTWALAPVGGRTMSELRKSIDFYAEKVIR